MTNYTFLKEWDNIPGYNGVDEVQVKVSKVFSKWERENLTITYGNRKRTVSDTYGFPYTSSSNFAMISNCNVTASLKDNQNFSFDYLAITENREIVAGFSDADENEKLIVIGTL